MEQIDIPQERHARSWIFRAGDHAVVDPLAIGLYWLTVDPAVRYAGNAVISAAARRTLCSIACRLCSVYMARNTADAVLQERAGAHGPVWSSAVR